MSAKLGHETDGEKVAADTAVALLQLPHGKIEHLIIEPHTWEKGAHSKTLHQHRAVHRARRQHSALVQACQLARQCASTKQLKLLRHSRLSLPKRHLCVGRV
jgi:hypothetical protein